MSASRERVSGYRRFEPSAIYAVASLAASAGTYLLFALLLHPVPHDLRAVAASAILIGALIVHALGVPFTRFARHGRQSIRSIAFAGRTGRLYFGALLGVGVATHMTTPLVWASLFLAAVEGPHWALIAGLAFGLGRAVPAIAGAVVTGRRWLPGRVTATLLGYERAARAMGVIVAGIGLVAVWR